ncbi:MAG TPA: hypothetical protein VMZ25_05485 [Terriglobales bacterium]|nr:hypothetical protein [Terriglobales bacterium]
MTTRNAKRCLFLFPILLASTFTLSADDWLAKFERECRAKGGTPEHYASGGGKCVMPASSSSSSSSSSTYSPANNPYQPMVDGLLKWIFSTNNNAAQAKQRREAMMRELAAQREQARRNQQVAQAQRLEAIMQRLMGDSDLILKGMSNTDGLRLKLGEKRPLGMEVYQHPEDGKKRMGISGLSGINLDNETPTTTRAQLTLKLGDDATRSLQTPPAAGPAPGSPDKPSEGKDSATAPPATAAEQDEAKTQIDDLARTISQLSPEEQQKLLAALQRNETAAPSASPEPSQPAANAGLSLELSGTPMEAGKLGATTESGTSPEQLKQQAEDQFRLQGITADPIKIGQSPEPGIPNKGASAASASPPAPIDVASPSSALLADLPAAASSNEKPAAPSPDCSSQEKLLALDQQAMRRLQASIQQGTAELESWGKAHAKAEEDALKHASDFLIDTLTAKLGEVGEGKLAKLEDAFKRRAPMGETWQRKLEKVREFRVSRMRMEAAVDGLKVSAFATAGINGWDDGKKWAKNTNRDAETLDAILSEWRRDPELQQVLKETGFSLTAAGFGFSKALAPLGSAMDLGSFLVNYGYDATGWKLSRDRIQEQLSNRDREVEAIKKLDEQIKRSVTKLKACRNGNITVGSLTNIYETLQSPQF